MATVRLYRETLTRGAIGQLDKELMELALELEWNRYADAFNEEVDKWNSEWEKLYPNVYVGEGSEHEAVYMSFLCERAQRIVDALNEKDCGPEFPYEFCIDKYTQLEIRMKADKDAVVSFIFKEA